MPHTPPIRPYLPADLAAVIALWDVVFPNPTAWNTHADVIARKLTVQPELFLVAISNDDVIGTVLAGFDGVRGWIHRLCVHPDHRRQGLASALMGAAERGLATLGCPKVNLQVRETNLDVIAFYAALGYHVEDRASLGKPL